MDNNTVESLKEALKYSPQNIPLKIHLAETLVQLNRLDEAEQQYQEILAIGPLEKATVGLAGVFYQKGQYSKCNVVLEELVHNGNGSLEVLLLHARALVKEHHTADAVNIYEKVLGLYPGFRDEELDKELRIPANFSTNEEQDEVDDDLSPFIQKPSISFKDVGGMDAVKKEIEMKIIHPLNHADLYKAYGKKTGGGILLYGPPGCGKTYIAKATAGQVNARFINVGLNDILDMWIGSSEKNLHEVFEMARRNAPCVLFFDEIDALGASRSDMKQSAGRHLINQFLQELDGIESSNEGVLVMGATNAPWHLDTAFRRPGRFDRIIFVPPPDTAARASILQLKLKDKPVDNVDYDSIAKKTPDYSGADLEAIIDITIEQKLEASFSDGVPKPIQTGDLANACKKHKASTLEWFSTAKNFALYANDSGLYDDILIYMKARK